ncbi:DUF5954 family protein [Streptomyces sp. Ncost-T10-10d]|uniref:DUF5954 family protein n=1 Tax=Streptomyces sp. Ncost-T10-10d TaxID=1839774 RepID=UPI0035229D2C
MEARRHGAWGWWWGPVRMLLLPACVRSARGGLGRGLFPGRDQAGNGVQLSCPSLTAAAHIGAHTAVAKGASSATAELAVHAEAADRLQMGRLNQIEVNGTVSRIVRPRRLLRWGLTVRKAHARPTPPPTPPKSSTHASTRTASSTSGRHTGPGRVLSAQQPESAARAGAVGEVGGQIIAQRLGVVCPDGFAESRDRKQHVSAEPHEHTVGERAEDVGLAQRGADDAVEPRCPLHRPSA